MSANILSSELKASIGWLNIQPLALSNVTDSSTLAYDQTLATGVAAGQADQIWGFSETLGAGVTRNIVLSALNETVFGSTVALNMKKVKAILLLNLSTTSGDVLTLTPNSSNPFKAPFNGQASPAGAVVGAASALLLASVIDGWATTTSSADSLALINPGSNPIAYQIAILGTSA
jgi:hypothetical protein